MESMDVHQPNCGVSLATISESTPLIENIPSHWSVLAVRYRNTRKCISSKAALLILFWSFTLSLAYGIVTNPGTAILTLPLYFGLVTYGIIAFVLIFYPLAGFLADVKFGRYKTVFRSLYLIAISLVVILLTLGIGLVLFETSADYFVGLAAIIKFTISIVMFVTAGIAFIIMLIGFTGFTANVVQFGMDQLHDSPGEDRTLFIHWYVWVYYVSLFIIQSAWVFLEFDEIGVSIGIVAGIPLIATVLLIISLCLGYRRRRWFLIEPGSVNPYKLVYRVFEFAYQHKTPVNRSAFTYCEDELPSGLDLGKDKYGGPFTTEEVEDVKAFYGILKVLFSFGMVLFLDFAAHSLRPWFYDFQFIWLLGHNISLLVVVVCIPLYLFLLRPFISYHIPGMLKRMGIGMCLVLLSLILSFSVEAAYNTENFLCIFLTDGGYYNDTHSVPHLPFVQSNSIPVVQNILSALSDMLIYIAVFEFICSQSPHSMKGLLIGLWYAIKGLYQMLAAALVVPYMFWYKSSFPYSCGFGYYLMNVLIGVPALLVYVCVARRYKYRERDEPCHLRQYAEEYYSNIQHER